MKTTAYTSFIIVTVLLFSCYAKQGGPVVNLPHAYEKELPGGSKLFADPVLNESVVRSTEMGNGTTKFISFKVGFEDSTLLTNQDRRLKKGKYIQYDMEHDWKLMIQGDSLMPVFTQAVLKRTLETDVSVLVFEVPATSEPDTLVFSDSFNKSGSYPVIVKRN